MARIKIERWLDIDDSVMKKYSKKQKIQDKDYEMLLYSLYESFDNGDFNGLLDYMKQYVDNNKDEVAFFTEPNIYRANNKDIFLL